MPHPIPTGAYSRRGDMETRRGGETDAVLSAWRTRILNGFLLIAAIACVPILVLTFLNALKQGDQWPAFALFAVLLLLLAVLAFWRSLDGRIRAWGILSIGYAAGVAALARGGLAGSGRDFLLVLPIIALILLGGRAGVFLSILSGLTLAVFAVLADRGLLLRWLILTENPLRLSDWATEAGSSLTLLAVAMVLLMLFHRFQIKTIEDQRRTADELEKARALLEEQNATLEQRIQERTDELSQSNRIQTALYKIAEAASVSHDMQEFYIHIHRVVGELMYAENMFIALYDESTGLVRFPFFVDEKEEPFPAQPLEDLHATIGYVIRTGESVKHSWHRPGASTTGPVLELGGTPCEDGIGAPLKADGKILGAIFVQSYRQGIHYTDQDDQVLAFVAQHIATALTRVRALEETRKRNSELQIINRVQEGLAYRLGLQGIIDLIGGKVGEILAADTTSVALYDEERDWVMNGYYVDRGQRISMPDRPVSRPSLGALVLDSRKPLLIGTLEESLKLGGLLVPRPGEEADKNESYLGVPILAQDRVIGLITIQSYQKKAYKQADVHLLQTLANSMSIALENARLFDETQRLLGETQQRTRELEAMSHVQQGLATRLDFQAIIDLVGDKLREVFGGASTFIALYDEASNRIETPYFVSEGGRRVHAPPFELGEGLTSIIIKTRRPLVFGTFQEMLARGALVEEPEKPKQEESWMGVPILVGERAIGAVAMQDYSEHRYTEADVLLLSTITAGMGVALENARLFEETNRLLAETEQRAAELAILNSVSEAMSKTLDLEDVTRIVGDKVRDIFDSDAVIIMLLDEQTDLIHVHYEFDRNEGGYIDHVEPFPLGTGLSSKVITSRQPLMLGTLDELIAHGAYFPPELLEQSAGGVSPSWLGVPIMVHDQVLGLVALADGDENAFHENHLRLLQTLASNMGVAIANARLFQAEQQRVAELATINTVSRELASELGADSLIHLVGEQIRAVFNADIAYVALLDESGTMINFPYTYGEELDPLRYGEGLAGKIIETGEPLLINEELDRQTLELGAATIGRRARSYLGVPIVVSGRPVGVISVQSTEREGVFDLNDRHLLNTLAANVSAALHSARLFDEAQEARAAAEQASTEIKQAQEALQESHRQLADIVNFMPDAVLVIDREGQVIAWNRAIEEMTGTKAEAMLGKGNYEYALPFYGERRPILIDLVTVPRKEMEEKYSHIRMEGPVLVGETYVPQLRGGGHYLLGTASALHDSKGEIVGAIEVIRDFTERKRMEEALHQAKEAAEAATQTKSAFLATMSHEIRTPMNAVIGMTGLLLDTPLTPEQREFAETIRTSGDALLTIINDVLDFSKIEARRMDLERQPFDLRECVESAMDLLAAGATEKGLYLGCVVERNAPAAIVGDVTRLRQVLVNLLSNAVKFTEQGEVVVTVEGRGEATSPLREIHFSVRDTGIGIPPELMGRLFQSFSQVDASTTRRFGGTGLGLAISRHLVELMGGTMWAESPVAAPVPGGGPGSIFHFTIQAEVAPAPTAAAYPQGIEARLEGKRALIVDDNPTNRRILALQTQAWGMLSHSTASPAEALEWLRRGDPFDVAFLDLQMPDMDGAALAAEIRRLRDASALPLVMVSSLGKREAQAEEGDWAAFLLKPIKASQLYNTLVGVFGTEAGAAPVPQPPGRPPFEADMGQRHPLRILVAEDNLVNQKLALRLLERMGYRADVAANGLEVLQSLRRQPYDVILMDVQMPEMDGLEASRAICDEWPSEQRPRLIAMTANVMAEDRQECLAAGMDDFVAKPIRVDELVAALRRSRPLAGSTSSSGAEAPDGSSPGSAPPATVLDPVALERLREMAGGDAGFLQEMIETFLADAPGMLAEMRQSLEREDAATLRRAAHSLKSNSADFGARALYDLCRELEMMGKAGALEGAAGKLASVEAEWAQVRAALEALQRG
jgi:PAS domain S-box-containing protein